MARPKTPRTPEQIAEAKRKRSEYRANYFRDLPTKNPEAYAKHLARVKARTDRLRADPETKQALADQRAEERRKRRAKDPDAYDAKQRDTTQRCRDKHRQNGTGDPNGVKWAANNRGKVNGRRRTRYATDPKYRIACCLRARLSTAFRRRNSRKITTTLDLTGCTLDDLVAHLSSRFTAGMTLENYGEWEIDHITPICSFDLEDVAQVQRCFHYTNLQPLWSADNAAKRAQLA